ncbi:MAG: hypothetical protein JNM95_04080 [Chitinophagaceae bacterium]|nr:hypothetical protein [Chitinophagaceae bacterium]
MIDILREQKLISDEQYLTHLSIADQISRMLYTMITNRSQ